MSFRLALLAFVVYNINLRSITSFDTYPTRLLPVAILTDHRLDLDSFTFLRESRFTGSPTDSTPYFMTYRHGHWLSKYPIMPALLATPFYAIPVLAGIHRGAPIGGVSRVEVVATLLSKLVASLAIAASVAFVYLALRCLTRPRAAIVLALVYAFATSSWSVSSQGLWQMAFSQPMLALALLALLRAHRGNTSRWITLAGVALALCVACRPPMLLVALPLAIFVLHRHSAHWWRFAAAPAVIGALLVSYNLYYFGTLIGGYDGLPGTHVLSWPMLAAGLDGLLLSPNRGLLVFSPILIAAFAGMWLVVTRRASRRDELLAFVTLAVVATLLQYATFTEWHGSFGFSYRFLAELLPAFVLLIAPVWNQLVASAARRAVLSIAIGYSVCVQVIGAFYYPCGWYQSPAGNPQALARFYSWHDMELLQCVRAGPVDPDGLRAIRGALGMAGGGRVAR